jgi:CHASE2 domain-containing sensor protein
VGFLLQPAKLATAFFLSPVGTQGLATIRADFTGFFIGASLFALYGAWKQRSDALLVPIALLGIAFFGRCISLALDGVAPTAIAPMVIEAVMMAVLLMGVTTFQAQRQAA